jgi:hypothetical protein
VIDALASIAAQLAWRGPSGKCQGHVVLDREQAQALLRALCLVSPPQVPDGAEPRIIPEISDGNAR